MTHLVGPWYVTSLGIGARRFPRYPGSDVRACTPPHPLPVLLADVA
jgi:hypothetical protein